MDAGQHAEQPGKSPLRSLFEFIVMVALIFVMAWAMRTFLFEAYEIPSGSMETTIMTGDMVLAEKVTYYSREPQAGDIVTFTDPLNDERVLIKRCIAVGGQTVNVQDGVLYIDGVAQSESYTRNLPSYQLSSQVVSYPYEVPEGYIWVMGDNRTNSQDSRYFGAIPLSSVKSKAVAIYWPLDHIGKLE